MRKTLKTQCVIPELGETGRTGVAKTFLSNYGLMRRECESQQRGCIMTTRQERHPSEEELFAFLGDPDSYPHHPDRVELVQTHISVVALAGEQVYKVKKPVNPGFLDFSTLEKRRAACDEEVRLNRRLAPGTYEGVVSIRRHDGRLTFGDEGEIVDAAVKMKRLSEEGFLHRRLDQGAISAEDIERVASTLARFYREQQPCAEISAYGRPEWIQQETGENFDETEQFVGSVLPGTVYRVLCEENNRFLANHALLLNRRRTSGRILDCHGDLRLEHIHLDNDEITIFDCIEFNEAFRFVDVASDIAFLAMDLDHAGRPDLGRHLIDRMATELNDPDLHTVINFYKAYRACVRGKVACLTSSEHEIPAEQRSNEQRSACRYYQLALQYSVAGSHPTAIVLMGRVATGKSTLAVQLADLLGWPLASSDHIRKSMVGLPVDQRTPPDKRQEIYNETVTRQTYETMKNHAIENAARGVSTVLDATYSRRADRDDLRNELRKHDVPYVFVELTTSDSMLRERLSGRDMRPAETSDARLEDFGTLQARYEAPDALEDARHLVVSTECTTQESLASVLRKLAHNLGC